MNVVLSATYLINKELLESEETNHIYNIIFLFYFKSNRFVFYLKCFVIFLPSKKVRGYTESAQIELMKELEKKQPPRQRKEHFEQKIEYSKELIACLKRLK